MEAAESLFANILDIISQGALLPTMVILVALIVYGVYVVGSLLAEIFTERKHFNLNMPDFLQGLDEAELDATASYIADSGMLGSQKSALIKICDNMNLAYETRLALARKTTCDIKRKLQARLSRTDIVAKIAPMFGLMGTLIPLGPGIIALGNGDTATLATSIGIAFNTTVAGLIVAVICLVVTRIRKAWYDEYVEAAEAAMTSLLEKIDIAEEMEEGGYDA